MQPQGYSVVTAVVPKKLLAVRSGLAAYGKNNITYVPGSGSFHRLVAFHTDVHCEEDPWQEPTMVERCQNCEACLRRCPTGAITADRFLLRAERCLTFHNEKDSAVAFPEWLDPAWHTCLVGCMYCQLVCPENRHVAQWVEEGPRFSQEETALILQGVAPGQLPDAALDGLKQFGLLDIYEVLARNLRVLLDHRDSEG